MAPTNKKIIQKGLKAAGYYAGAIDGIWGNGTKAAIKHLQRELRGLGLYWKKIDGDYGWGTFQAVKHFQVTHGNPITGVFNEGDGNDIKKRYTNHTHDSAFKPLKPIHHHKYPRETRDQREIREFYGNVGQNQTRIKLPYKMHLSWDKSKTVTKMTCHKKVADDLSAIWEDVYKTYGEDVHKLCLDSFGGSLNVRKMRGANRYSLHSFGIAVDMCPEKNSLHMHRPKALFSHSDYNEYWAIVAQHGGYSLGVHRNYDWMHFAFAWR